ncbi:MAG: hypothetical protein GX277_02075 [Bacteroidales bacterium]|nr:hypothetical protein [Bacteroidales bacterium]
MTPELRESIDKTFDLVTQDAGYSYLKEYLEISPQHRDYAARRFYNLLRESDNDVEYALGVLQTQMIEELGY